MKSALLFLLVFIQLIFALLNHKSKVDYESIFLGVPSNVSARAHLQYYTSFPHMFGTPGDKALAIHTFQKFQEYGLSAEIVEFNVMQCSPKSNRLAIVEPAESKFVASLAEDVLPSDSTSDTWFRNHTFTCFGASGNVTGKLVYANYGRKEDFQALVAQNIPLSGNVAIVRYGKIFRGLKAKFAQEHGLAGLLIYSDPMDDGFKQGPVYPDGPWRPSSGVQRGGLPFVSLCSGDPGFVSRDPAVCGYQTKDLIPQIPVLPLSYGDALPLLKALSGTPAPADWQGGLDISYNIGPGPAVVNLDSEVEYQVGPIWNVFASIPGSSPTSGKQAVLIGNHRDAWVYGATDPNSGTAALLEVARGLGQLLSQGWKPLRSIVLCSWDGEEAGLMGSTHFGETNAAALFSQAVAYLNVDVAVTGSKFSASITPSLVDLLQSVVERVSDPNTGKPLALVWDGKLGRLGSGSDYSVFLDHLGIASADLSFEGPYGVYHSVYDSFDWMAKWGDPEFVYHQAMAQVWGLMTLRLANARVLPFNFTAYAQALATYESEVKAQAVSAGLTSLSWSSLTQAINQFTAVAEQVDAYRAQISADTAAPDSVLLDLNEHLYRLERFFLDPKGLPQRKWFQHVVQAPGINEGYAANVFPGIVQQIGNKDAAAAQAQVLNVANIIAGAARYLLQPVSNPIEEGALPRKFDPPAASRFNR